jgi:hypothetical protein
VSFCAAQSIASFGKSLQVKPVASSLHSAQSVTFRQSAYIRALNKALELEESALECYRTRLLGQSQCQQTQDRLSGHHLAYRQLVKLIFSQRGIPESDPVGLVAITSRFASRVGKIMPSNVQTPVLDLTAHRIEMALIKRYWSLLKLAPSYDLDSLQALLQQARDFSEKNL